MDILPTTNLSPRRPWNNVGTTASRPSAGATTPTELLNFPARLLVDLPEPVTLRLQVAGAPVPVYFATYPLALDPPVLADSITFDRAELCALLSGVQADRVWHADFLGFCFEKWRSPGFRVTEVETLAGANPDSTSNWTLERVLRRLQAELLDVELVNDPSTAVEREHPLLPAAA